MPDNTITRYFLGANSARGFYSLYAELAKPEDGIFLHVIKGGPGCGKSSFMKRIGARAEQAGLAVEYIHCSGDPSSLDAVLIPELGAAYADGTAPHVLDPPYPGAGGAYLDLGAFYRSAALRPRLEEIASVTRRYKDKYADGYALLSAAGSVSLRPAPELFSAQAEQTARRRARSLMGRELSGSGSGKRDRERFLSALTCRGEVFFDSTVTALCPRVCVLDNELGFAQVFLAECAAAARGRGYAAIICPDCLTPEKTRALLIPEAGLAVICADRRCRWTGETYRHIRLDALADPDVLRRVRPALRSAEKLRAALISQAEARLADAKALHDELERIYNPSVDFDGVYELAEKHAAALGI